MWAQSLLRRNLVFGGSLGCDGQGASRIKVTIAVLAGKGAVDDF
jgi:hypothetical protein